MDNNERYQAALAAGTAASTRRAYRRDITYFWAWAALAMDVSKHYPVSVDQVVRFILEHRGDMDAAVEATLLARGARRRAGPLAMPTLRRYLASLSVAHSEHGALSPVSDPRIKLLLRRLQQAATSERPHKKAALTAERLQHLLATCDDSLRGVRDRALLLTGFASGGRRRAELAALTTDSLVKIPEGYLIRLKRSKTDQQGLGAQYPVLGEAAAALSAWLMRSGIRRGPLFRGIRADGRLNGAISGRTINRIVKRRVALAGLEPEEYGAHSLRSGFITEAARRGTALPEAMALSGHRAIDVALGYYRQGEVLRNRAARLLEDD